MIVALIAAFVLVNVFAKPGAVTLKVYTDGDPFGVLDAAAYVIEPLDGVEGSEEYIAAACEDALRREGRGGRVTVKIDGGVVTVTVDGSPWTFASGGTALYPFFVDDTLYLPLRSVGERMGKVVTWVPELAGVPH